MYTTALVSFLFTLIFSVSYGQEFLKNDLDTAYIKTSDKHYSIRPLSVFKYQNIIFKNREGYRIRYVPTNRISAGIGFSHKFLVADIAIRIANSNNKDHTSRFDMQLDIPYHQHFLGVFVQRYRGFKSTEPSINEDNFREDIESSIWGMNYIYNFNPSKLSIKSIINGNQFQQKSAGAFLSGAYFSKSILLADSSVAIQRQEDFNQFAQISNLRIFNFGVMAGYAQIISLPADFFIFASLLPGLGINLGKTIGDTEYDLPKRPSIKINGKVAIGRNSEKFYTGITFNSDYFFIDLGNENRYRYNLGLVKFVLGIKLDFKNFFVDEII